MSGVVRVMVALIAGLALGISYNAWPIAGDHAMMVSDAHLPQTIDILSYAAGMLVGMFLWQVSSVPWSALPARMHAYLAAQVHFYQFVFIGAGCVAVLVYF